MRHTWIRMHVYVQENELMKRARNVLSKSDVNKNIIRKVRVREGLPRQDDQGAEVDVGEGNWPAFDITAITAHGPHNLHMVQ